MAVESVENICQKARQAVAQGAHEQARNLYQQALGLRPESPDVHYGLATVCFLLGDLHNAAFHFKEVTRLDPLRAGAHINLGAVYNRLDQVEDAIQVLRRGIQLDTHRAEGYYNLGLAYRRKKLGELAIQAYQEATRLNPRMPDAHLNLANAYLDKGSYGQAIAHYSYALDLRPDWDKAQNGIAQAEAAQAAARQAASPPAAEKDRPPEPASLASGVDPERMIDPNVHATMISNLHRATIESENMGRSFITLLEKEIEPAIKELSSCLLYSDTPLGEFDECLQKFETAIHSLRSAQRNLQSTIEQVGTLGQRLVKS